MPNLKTATHRSFGDDNKKSSLSTSRKNKEEAVQQQQQPKKDNRFYIWFTNFTWFVTTYLTLRNIAILFAVIIILYVTMIIYQNYFDSIKRAEYLRKQTLEIQHKNIQMQEKIAEKYYSSLLIERKQTLAELTNDAFLKINPQFPCLYGELPVTKQDENDAIVTDGHKYVCGLKSISGAPIVYSIGGKDQDFELGVLKYRPDAEIYIFELKQINVPLENEQNPKISYYNIGLGYDDPKKLKPLVEMMRMLDHKYIDVLKIDIEYAEWQWVARETHLLNRVGQLLVEVHTKDNRRFPYQGPNPGLFFIEKLEEKGLRLYHKEYSTTSKNFVELSMIQKDWSDWEIQKSSLEDLPAPYDPAEAKDKYEIEYKIFYGIIPAPTPLPVTLSAAPTKANSNLKTKGTIFDLSGATYTNREKLSTNYLKDKILGSTEVYGPEDTTEETSPTPAPKKIEASSGFFSNAAAEPESKKKSSTDTSSEEQTNEASTEESEEALPAAPKSHSAIQTLDDIGS